MYIYMSYIHTYTYIYGYLNTYMKSLDPFCNRDQCLTCLLKHQQFKNHTTATLARCIRTTIQNPLCLRF